ncbi:hypothetical protein GGR56DRAFT_122505 [Xylariaceae sp. FL0804]|nr:hypothetical protein GGR56DRAFT_122505 [Xylariaceae sp. FL0804]
MPLCFVLCLVISPRSTTGRQVHSKVGASVATQDLPYPYHPPGGWSLTGSVIIVNINTSFRYLSLLPTMSLHTMPLPDDVITQRRSGDSRWKPQIFEHTLRVFVF